MPDLSGSRDLLVQALGKVRRTVRQVRDRKDGIGEEPTKTALIIPVLQALGWDTTDLDEVLPEYKHTRKDNPVDYALLVDQKPCLFVEAKALDTNIDDHKWMAQAVNYANTAGVEWCVLTDGNTYSLYNTHAPVPVGEKLFLTANVTDGKDRDEGMAILELLSKGSVQRRALSELWDRCFVDRQVQLAIEALFGDHDALVRSIKRRTSSLSAGQIRASVERADLSVAFPPRPLCDVPEPAPPTPRTQARKRATPVRIELAGQRHDCAFAKGILIHVAEWLVGQAKLKPEQCPVTVTRRGGRGIKRCLVNSVAEHPGGHAFRAAAQLSNGLYVEAHAGRVDLERYARLLLRWAGVDDSTLVVL